MREVKSSSLQGNWRFEVKYRISVFDYHKIRLAITPFMTPDNFSCVSLTRKYLVRSLYYDTYDYKIYQEKMSGDHERVKFRLRTYSKDISNDSIVKAEMKIRKGNAMEKISIPVTNNEYESFMSSRHWSKASHPALIEFERLIHLWALYPQVLVEYHRHGYHDREKKGIRITFDHKVKGAHETTLYPAEHIFFREFHPGLVVMEIKCRNEMPDWLRNIIRNYGLRWVANSKFTQGIQAGRKDLYYPDGLVIIR